MNLGNVLTHLDCINPKAESRNIPTYAISKHNATIIREHIDRCKALPSEPGEYRLAVIASRLKSISHMIKDAPLEELTEEELKRLNIAMRERGLLSAHDYRKTLRQFLRMLDEEKYFKLLKSPYLKAPPKKSNERKLVNPETFWSMEEINRYLETSKAHSPRQGAFAAIWLSSGMRPHEILNLTKNDVIFEGNYLKINVREGKTGHRRIVLNGTNGTGTWIYIEPYIKTLTETQKLFPYGWDEARKLHRQTCRRIKLPKTKDWKLYMARKMVLTKFYNTFGLAKASHMAGHTPGSKAMKHYIGLTDEQLCEEETPTIELKVCPNPLCGLENEPHEDHCVKCHSPLDKKVFASIFEAKEKEYIDKKFEAFKLQWEAQNWKTHSTLK